jgi:anti-sigma regulatory factor (Ser/Thr protein kinase)
MTAVALKGGGAVEGGASFSVGGGPGVAADARAAIAPLSAQLGTRLAGDLALLLTELVTNSYRHSGAAHEAIGVEVSLGPGRVRCEVTDQGPGFLTGPLPPDRRGEGGWGLYIVDRMVDRWGVRSGPPTRVWFEIRR